jgi:hypothetical protein
MAFTGTWISLVTPGQTDTVDAGLAIGAGLVPVGACAGIGVGVEQADPAFTGAELRVGNAHTRVGTEATIPEAFLLVDLAKALDAGVTLARTGYLLATGRKAIAIDAGLSQFAVCVIATLGAYGITAVRSAERVAEVVEVDAHAGICIGVKAADLTASAVDRIGDADARVGAEPAVTKALLLIDLAKSLDAGVALARTQGVVVARDAANSVDAGLASRAKRIPVDARTGVFLGIEGADLAAGAIRGGGKAGAAEAPGAIAKATVGIVPACAIDADVAVRAGAGIGIAAGGCGTRFLADAVAAR